MRFQLHYFKFTRSILLSRINNFYKPFSIYKFLNLRITLGNYSTSSQEFCFYTCIFFSSLFLLITKQFPKIIKNNCYNLMVVTLRKSTLYGFFDRVINLALVTNFKYLTINLQQISWSPNINFYIQNFYFFPESLLLLNNYLNINYQLPIKVSLYFNQYAKFKRKVGIFNIFQIPLLPLVK